MTISCEQCREWLSDLLEDEDQAQPDSRLLQSTAQSLTNGSSANHAPSRVTLLAHIATCPDCACDLNMLRNIRSDLRVLPQQTAPSNLRTRVRAQLAATSASAPLLAPPVVATETLNQVPALNGNYRPAPQYTPRQPSFITSLTHFFSRPANMAWASGAAIAAFCLVLFTQEQPRIVMPPTGLPAATQPAPRAAVPKAGHPHHGVAIVPHSAMTGQKGAGAATIKQPKTTTPNDTSPVPDAPYAALTTPPTTASDEGVRHHARHGLAAQGSNDERPTSKYQATTPAADHTNSSTHQGKAATGAIAATGNKPLSGSNVTAPTPMADSGAQDNSQTLSTPPPFARLALSAAPAITTNNQGSATPDSVNPLGPGTAGPGTAETGSANPPSGLTAPPIATAESPGAPSLPTHGDNPPANIAPSTVHPRIAINPGRMNHQKGAPLRPDHLTTPKATIAGNFGPVGAERAAHLIVVPPRDIKAARLDIQLSSGLRYADQADGWRTVWHGAAQGGHPIAVDLHLVATTEGMQSLKVKLMEVGTTGATGDTEDATLAHSETLNLNVTAP